MTPTTMTEETAAEAMRPIPQPIPLDSTAAEARNRMREENLSFLAVVSPDNEKLLGVVLRGALERACESNGHDPETCPLVQHLKTDIDFCFAEESVEEVMSVEPDLKSGEGLQARKARVRRSLPVLVVDEAKVPVGFLVR
jgi:CBS domain-containing protein